MTTDRDPVTEALDGLLAWIDDLDHQLPAHLAGADTAGLVHLLYRMEGLRKRLAALEAEVERRTADALGTGRHDAGTHQIEVHGGWKREAWHDEEVARLLVERSLLDEDTGEVPADDDPVVRAALAAVRVVLAAGRMSWRVTDLRAAGVDVDDLCKSVPKRKTVQFLSGAETT
jgi:hypothetical protein